MNLHVFSVPILDDISPTDTIVVMGISYPPDAQQAHIFPSTTCVWDSATQTGICSEAFIRVHSFRDRESVLTTINYEWAVEKYRL